MSSPSDNPRVDLVALQQASASELMTMAHDDGLELVPGSEHGELVFALFSHRLGADAIGEVEGTFELLPDGFGFARSPLQSWTPRPFDVFVSQAQVKKLNLKPGHRIAGPVRGPRGDERFFALQRVERINDGSPEEAARRVPFASRSPILPTQRLRLVAADRHELTAIDAIAPWAKGHRVLVAVPSQVAARARLLAGIASALRRSDAEIVCTLCLLDQRAEDVAAARNLTANSSIQVVATTFDEPPARHVAVAELALAAAMRDVEAGRDVVLLLDSLTAFARSCHVEQPPSGRLAVVGLDALATMRGKRLFSAARACEEGGSLTVIATAVQSDARVDQAILDDFARSANSTVVYAMDLSPEVTVPDLRHCATRVEDLVQTPAESARSMRLRQEIRARPDASPSELLGTVLDRLANEPKS